MFSRNDIVEQQKIKIFKLESGFKAKSDDVIALSANLKQLSDRTDMQILINENKRLVELNHRLNRKINDKQIVVKHRIYILMFLVAMAAVIVGILLGKFI
ncbi:hypothetical protein ACG59Z_18505 [Acinetobacter sp. ABJ_C1_1]|uniref:hypothetical protein n=1 Tax=Acinetobacter sp. ABJ_C1_1 TaxID=3378321 RepID=UPI0037DDD23B